MKDGVNDIKNHKWFEDFSWDEIEKESAKAPYIPTIKDPSDTSNFSEYPDSPEEPTAISPDEDPFKDW